MKSHTATLQIASAFLLFVSCVGEATGRESQHESTNKIQVVASTPILADWIQQIGGERVSVSSIIPHSTNPHSYRPGARDIAHITRSTLVFTVGLNYEDTWLSKLLTSHEKLKRVVLGDIVLPIEIQTHKDESNNEHQELEHPGKFDPHFWFDPSRVLLATEAIATSLSTMDPGGGPYYMGRFNTYRSKLNALDNHLFTEFEKLPSNRRIVMTEHESLQYLGDRYQIDILRSVIPDVNSTASPTPKDLATAINTVREQNVAVIFVEKESVGSFAKQVARETGVKIATGLTVETLTQDQTYIDFMRYNLDVLIDNLSR